MCRLLAGPQVVTPHTCTTEHATGETEIKYEERTGFDLPELQAGYSINSSVVTMLVFYCRYVLFFVVAVGAKSGCGIMLTKEAGQQGAT